MVKNRRRLFFECLTLLLFTIKKAKRIFFQAPLTVRAKIFLFFRVIANKFFSVGRPTDFTADRVHLDANIFDRMGLLHGRRTLGGLFPVASKCPRGGELPELVPDHVLGGVNRDEFVAVVDRKRVADEIR